MSDAYFSYLYDKDDASLSAALASKSAEEKKMFDAPSTSAAAAPAPEEAAALVPAAEEKKMIILILQSEDGVNMEVPENVAFQSNLLKKMVEDLGIEDPDSPMLKEPLKMTSIKAEALTKIIEWCTKHRGEVYKPKDEDEDFRITLTKEDEEWMNVSNEKLISMLLAANFLDIPGIIDIITQKIANMGKDKTVEELRELYGFVNDFTPEEEEEIRKRFEWVDK